jgi:hypothetical protein
MLVFVTDNTEKISILGQSLLAELDCPCRRRKSEPLFCFCSFNFASAADKVIILYCITTLDSTAASKELEQCPILRAKLQANGIYATGCIQKMAIHTYQINFSYLKTCACHEI